MSLVLKGLNKRDLVFRTNGCESHNMIDKLLLVFASAVSFCDVLHDELFLVFLTSHEVRQGLQFPNSLVVFCRIRDSEKFLCLKTLFDHLLTFKPLC